MIYTPAVRFAANILFSQLGKKIDKGGYPYVMHPLHLAEQMDTEDAAIVALLHDVIEDSDDPLFAELSIHANFNQRIYNAVKLLTRDKSIPYADYIAKIKDSGNEVAIQVKIADLHHNLDESRLLDSVELEPRLKNRYLNALQVLGDNGTEPPTGRRSAWFKKELRKRAEEQEK